MAARLAASCGCDLDGGEPIGTSADLERAAAFVSARGTPAEQAQLRYILTGEPVPPEMTAAIFAGQRADGGLAPFWAPDYSSLDATCFRLAQAERAGMALEDEALVAALLCLRQRQRADGSWEEDEAIRELAPPWAMPGDLAATLYLTANCAFWLSMLPQPDDAAARGARFLAGHLTAAGELPSFSHTQWLAIGLWQRLGLHEPAERATAALATHLDSETPASALAWLLTTLLLSGFPARHALVHRAAELLARAQRPDGGWSSEDGPDRDVHTTLEAIRALRFCGGE